MRFWAKNARMLPKGYQNLTTFEVILDRKNNPLIYTDIKREKQEVERLCWRFKTLKIYPGQGRDPDNIQYKHTSSILI